MQYMKYFNTENDLLFVQSGYEDCPSGYSNNVFSINSYIIHFVCSGKGIFTVGGKTYNLESGSAFLISPNLPAHYCADTGDPWSYMWFEIAGESARKFLKSVSLQPYSPIYQTSDPKRILEQFSCLFESFKTQNEYLYTAELLKLMGIMNETSLVRVSEKKQPARTCINKCIAYINNNFSEKISVKDLCRVANVERSYLFRLFKASMGMSPQEYIICYKMNYASSLIALNKASVAEAARSVGYDDQFAFSKLFKKQYGVSPSEYKRGINKPSAAFSEKFSAMVSRAEL